MLENKIEIFGKFIPQRKWRIKKHSNSIVSGGEVKSIFRTTVLTSQKTFVRFMVILILRGRREISLISLRKAMSYILDAKLMITTKIGHFIFVAHLWFGGNQMTIFLIAIFVSHLQLAIRAVPYCDTFSVPTPPKEYSLYLEDLDVRRKEPSTSRDPYIFSFSPS